MRYFHDIHLGKRIWVCGGGPSLLKVEQDRLTENDIIIACNSARLHFGVPDYWLVIDGNVRYTTYLQTIDESQTVINLNPLIKFPRGKIINVFHSSADHMDFRASKNTHFPGHSTQRAVSFAYAMGASKIILAGCDCDGNHPYAPQDDEGSLFNDDLIYWKKIARNNLPIYTISQNGKTPFPIITFDEAIW